MKSPLSFFMTANSQQPDYYYISYQNYMPSFNPSKKPRIPYINANPYIIAFLLLISLVISFTLPAWPIFFIFFSFFSILGYMLLFISPKREKREEQIAKAGEDRKNKILSRLTKEQHAQYEDFHREKRNYYLVIYKSKNNSPVLCVLNS